LVSSKEFVTCLPFGTANSKNHMKKNYTSSGQLAWRTAVGSGTSATSFHGNKTRYLGMACACAREANEFRMARFAVVTEGLEAASMPLDRLSGWLVLAERASSINGDSSPSSRWLVLSEPGLQLYELISGKKLRQIISHERRLHHTHYFLRSADRIAGQYPGLARALLAGGPKDQPLTRAIRCTLAAALVARAGFRDGFLGACRKLCRHSS
jgi:hypothetical protein